MQMTFATGNATQFQGINGMGAMGSGMIFMLNGSLQPDGSVTASYVQQMMGSGGVLVMGMDRAVTGSPATQFSMVPMDGSGNGVMSSFLSSGMTVNVGSSTVYSIDTQGADMLNLPSIPVFDADHVYAGQMIVHQFLRNYEWRGHVGRRNGWDEQFGLTERWCCTT